MGGAGGAGRTGAGVALFGDALPVPPRMGLYPYSLSLAALYGLLTAAAFALWPLARAAQISGAALFRSALLPTRLRARPLLLLANAAVALLLVALTVATSPERRFAAYFCAAALATLALFWAGGVALTFLTQWALRGDRGLTYSRTVPEGSHIVAGQWWPADYDGPPLVSFDAALAAGWGAHLGSVIRVNVLGRDIDLKVASLRDVAWRTLSINFTLVASPGLLEHAPHTHIATVRAAPADEGAILRAVTDALPNVSGIRVADVLGAVAELVGKIAAALAATGSVTLASGALVLAGAVAAGQRRRIAEAVVLRTLGATRRQIRAAWLVEFGVIGAVAGLLACGVGTAASWGVVRFVMHADWVFLPGVLAATVGSCVVLMLGFGYLGTETALRARPAGYLRNE